MELKDLLHNLGQKAGLPNLTVDDGGACRIVQDDIVVDLKTTGDERHLLLFGRIASMPFEGQSALVRRLLCGNHQFSKTNGATIGLDVVGNSIYLQQQVALDCLDDEAFEKLLDDFVATIDKWILFIERFQQSEEAQDNTAPQQDGIGTGPQELDSSTGMNFLRV